MSNSFEDLEVWKRACRQALEIYSILKDTKDYSLKNQMERAAVSVPSNIAEGAGRNSKAEFNQFLGYATGSTYELETQLLLSEKLGFLETEELATLLQGLQRIQKSIYSLKSSLMNQKN